MRYKSIILIGFSVIAAVLVLSAVVYYFNQGKKKKNIWLTKIQTKKNLTNIYSTIVELRQVKYLLDWHDELKFNKCHVKRQLIIRWYLKILSSEDYIKDTLICFDWSNSVLILQTNVPWEHFSARTAPYAYHNVAGAMVMSIVQRLTMKILPIAVSLWNKMVDDFFPILVSSITWKLKDCDFV